MVFDRLLCRYLSLFKREVHLRKPLIDISLCKNRREVLKEDFNEAALILAAAPEDSSRYSSYRQDSHFFALTGFEEPDSIFLFRPGKNPESTLFVRPKDIARETWDGYRFGAEGAISEFAMDEAHSIEDFPKVGRRTFGRSAFDLLSLGS